MTTADVQDCVISIMPEHGIVQLCAWCPTERVKKAKAWAMDHKYSISHGLCPVCLEQQLRFVALDL